MSRPPGGHVSQAGPTGTDQAERQTPLTQPQAPQQMPEEHPSSTSRVTRELAAHPWGKIGGVGKGSS